MVHQHFMLVPVFTVTENIVLGQEKAGPLGLLDRREAEKMVADLSGRLGLDVPPDALVEDLPVGVQQRVEIVKALYRRAKVLDPGRADGGPDPAGDRRLLPGSRDGESRVGHLDHLHLAQAPRGPRDRRPRDRHAAGEGRRQHHAGRVERATAGLHDGRPDGAVARRKGTRDAGRERAGSAGPARGRRPGPSRGGRRLLRRPGRRDTDPGRRAGKRADRAGRGADRPAAPVGGNRRRLGARPDEQVAA